MSKIYRTIKLTDKEHDNFVFPHVMAMTGEKLHSKAEIAHELGVRDKRIAELHKMLLEVPLTYADEWSDFNCTFCGNDEGHDDDCICYLFKQLRNQAIGE